MPLAIDSLRLDQLTADPVAPIDGQMWYNITEKRVKSFQNGKTEVVFPFTHGEVVGTSIVTTQSGTDVPFGTDLTVTPPVGTYLVWYSGDSTMASNGNAAWFSLYVGGVQVLASERAASRGTGAAIQTWSGSALVTVNGAQAINVRWRTTGGVQATNTRRTLSYLKVA